MPFSPKDGSIDSLDQLLDAASHHSADKGFADSVIDAAYAEPQTEDSPQIVRFLAPSLAAAAGVAITLLITGPKDDHAMLVSEEPVIEAAADTDIMIELDSISSLLALESASDFSLVEDEDLDALLF